MRLQINKQTKVFSYDKRLSRYKTEDDKTNHLAWFSGYCCPACGAELYGQWLTTIPHSELSGIRHVYHLAFPADAREDTESFFRLDKCPLCGGTLSRSLEDGFFVTPKAFMYNSSILRTDAHIPNSFEEFANNEYFLLGDELSYLPKLINDCFTNAEKQREKRRAPQARARIAGNISQWDVPAGSASTVQAAETIKKNLDSLKRYVYELLNLETDIYTLKERLTALYLDRSVVEDRVKKDKGKPLSSFTEKIEQLRMEKPTPKENTVIRLPEPETPKEPVYKEAGLFNKKKIDAENALIKANYEAQCAEYEERKTQHELSLQAWEEENIRLKKEAEMENTAAVDAALARLQDAAHLLYGANTQPVPMEEMLRIIDEEIEQAEKLLQGFFKTRNELYGCNIIFGKYRDPVALASFYEYLMAGRCESLEGANGAYNLYESEVRSNMIISQLSTVISQLEDIKDNQYTIYTEMNGMKKSLNELASTTKQAVAAIEGIEQNTGKIADYTKVIANNTSVIAYNTAKSAFYAKKNAELTNALGYMMALR